MTTDGPADKGAASPPGSGRRVRFAPNTDPKLRAWLTRVARCHAYLAATVKLYGDPRRAGGQSLLGEDFASRIAAGDPSTLSDALTHVANEIDEVRGEIASRMDSAPPTQHPPGSAGKVAEMLRRCEQGLSLFVAGDAKTVLPYTSEKIVEPHPHRESDGP